MKHPTLPLLLALVIGIAVGYALNFHIVLSVPVLVVAVVMMAVVMIVLGKRSTRMTFSVAVMITFVVIGMLRYRFEHDCIANRVADGTHYITGTVCEIPRHKPKTYEVTVKTDEGRRIVAYLERGEKANMGDRIAIYTSRGTQSTWNPNDKPYGSDDAEQIIMRYRRNLYLQGISATCYADSLSWRIINDKDVGHTSFLERLHQLQAYMVEAYTASGLDGDEGAIIQAITTGSKTQISPALRQQYSRSGLSHLLALSGFHLTIIYFILQFIMAAQLLSGRRRLLADIGTLVAIWTFVVITGAPPSLLRAAIMCSLLTLGNSISISYDLLTDKMSVKIGKNLDEMGKNRGLNSLILAAIIMLLCNPFYLFQLSFQLSFAAMLAIVMCSDITSAILLRLRLGLPVNKLGRMVVKTVNFIIQYVAGSIVISTISAVATMPLVAYHFQIISIVSPITTLIATPLTLVLIVLAIVWWAVHLFAIDPQAISLGLKNTAEQMNDLSRWTSQHDWSSYGIEINVVTVVAMYALVVVIYLMLRILLRRLEWIE